MRKSLIAGASVFALATGFGASAWADDVNVAVGLNDLNQTVTNTATVEEDGGSNQGIGGGAQNSLNNNFDDHTFQDQVLNQNNIDSGINSGQQGGNAAAIAVDMDGVGELILPPDFDANVAISGNIADQDVTNSATVNADDDPAPDGDEFDGIGGDANFSLNNNFDNNTFDNQVINQNNINSGINSAQQGGNAAALAVDLDGSEDELSVNAAFSGNYLTQDADNDAIVSDANNNNDNDDNDAIAGEVDDSLRNTFGSTTFENQVINQNNINSGINSAQQGANTVSIAASIGDPNIDLGPGDPDSPETDTSISNAIGAIEKALAFDVGGSGLGNLGSEVEAFEGNVAAARSQGIQDVNNNAFSSGEGDDSEEDSGIGGDPERSLHNNFGSETFRAQAINQNNINSGINSAQQGANTTAIAVDTDIGFNVLDVNIAVTDSNQDQDFVNTAETNDRENDGVGGFDNDGNPPPTDSLFNSFGDKTFQDQVINQNNINAGINSAQQGMNTTSMAIDNSGSIADVNAAWASTTAVQNGDNVATDESSLATFDDTGLGIGGNPSDNNLNNVFGNNTFKNQGINQNNINAGINSAQQGGNTSALAVADSVSFVDLNVSVATTNLTQGAEGDPLTNTATVDADDSGGVGGNAVGSGGIGAKGPLSNHFGDKTFQDQVMNQNNINSGINSAQQGANTTALSLDLGGTGGVDLNGAVSLASLSQTVTNNASAMGDGNGGVGGGATLALNNNFGDNTFRNQVMNQNNINSGINSVQQGANTVAIAVSGGSLP